MALHALASFDKGLTSAEKESKHALPWHYMHLHHLTSDASACTFQTTES
jgi:hypothetical protein